MQPLLTSPMSLLEPFLLFIKEMIQQTKHLARLYQQVTALNLLQIVAVHSWDTWWLLAPHCKLSVAEDEMTSPATTKTTLSPSLRFLQINNTQLPRVKEHTMVISTEASSQ